MTASGPREKQAHLWDRHPQDYYVEPKWCSRELFRREKFIAGSHIYDPACGMGRIVHAARLVGRDAYGGDIADRGTGMAVVDFLKDFTTRDNIVSNPPFGLCSKPPYPFVRHALAVARHKVVLLLPLTWLAGAKRSNFLRSTPLKRVWVLCPRPSMPPGPVIEAGILAGGGTTDYAWYVWDKQANQSDETTLRWILKSGG